MCERGRKGKQHSRSMWKHKMFSITLNKSQNNNYLKDFVHRLLYGIEC